MADLTEEEKARYDRQIRVWGAEAQTRIQNAKILVVGLNGLHPEVVKNVVLAGVSVVLLDQRTVDESDLAYNYFLKNDDVGNNVAEAACPRIQELNSFASVSVEKRSLSSLLESDADFLLQFTEILVSGGLCCGMEDAIRVDELVRKAPNGIPFFWSSVGGEEGVFVSDFGEHYHYMKKAPATVKATATDLTVGTSSSSSSRKRKAEDENDDNNKSGEEEEIAKKIPVKVTSPSFSQIINKKWSEVETKKMKKSPSLAKCVVMAKLMDMSRSGTVSNEAVADLVTAEMKKNEVPEKFLSEDSDINTLLLQLPRFPSVFTCSILGSYLAQEVIKGIGRTEPPNFNTSVYAGQGAGVVVYPINDEMKSPVD